MRIYLLSVCLLAISCSEMPQPERQPNILYIQSDTHRWGAMSFTQTPEVVTPHMEALARDGVSLDRYYVNLPLCTPYRAIMMTGHWPYQQGLMANHMSLGERVDMPAGKKTQGTIAHAFRDAGYTTGHFGKWHLGGGDARPFGFDRSVIWNNTNNHRENPVIIDGGEPIVWKGESNSTGTTEQALEWISEVSSGDQPFFAVVSLNPPHGPFHDAPASKKALYPNEAALPFHPMDETREFEQHRDYHALISGVDDDLGRVRAKLDGLGIADDTIVVYTSDHGGMTGIDGVSYGQKRHPNDESTRVPFLISWPGHIPEGKRLQTLSSTIDVFPTLAALARVRPETEVAEYMAALPGTDLSPFLLANVEAPAQEPQEVYLTHPSNMNNRGSRHEIVWRAIVTPEYTYAVTEEGEHRLWANGEGLQYEDLLDDPKYVETRRELWQRLDALLDKAERPFYDQWFRNASAREVAAWSAEHGIKGEDREAGKAALFDMGPSRPE